MFIRLLLFKVLNGLSDIKRYYFLNLLYFVSDLVYDGGKVNLEEMFIHFSAIMGQFLSSSYQNLVERSM